MQVPVSLLQNILTSLRYVPLGAQSPTRWVHYYAEAKERVLLVELTDQILTFTEYDSPEDISTQ